MKNLQAIVKLASLSGVVFWVTGCGNTAVIRHQDSISLEAEYGTDPSQPLRTLFGFDRRSVVAVPPKNPVAADSNEVPSGELLSTVSSLRVNRGESPGQLTIRTGVASGVAADRLTRAEDVQSEALESMEFLESSGGNRRIFESMRSIISGE